MQSTAVALWFGFTCALPIAWAADPLSGLEDLALPELRAQRARLETLREELGKLPPTPSDQSTERIGWHSRLGRDPKSPHSITVDLGTVSEFGVLALIPANVAIGTHSGPGYGFPVRFRIEALDDDPSALPVTLADFTTSDFPNPGNLPVVIETPGAGGRFVRVTATQLFVRDGFASFALGELMILRGQQNLAAGAVVRVSDNYANAPAWQPENATDGQSVLGPPLHIEPTPGNGFHSTIAREANNPKWVQLDLGASRPIEEVRLHAARPRDFPPRRGFGFPVRFRVEASSREDFAQPTLLATWTDRDFPNPGENPVTIMAHDIQARLVRVTATQLWERNEDFIFALSEMEVFSGGENIARGAAVMASDHLETGSWSEAQLNDGFTSQGRILVLPEWLRGLSRRREVLRECANLEEAMPALTAQALRRLALTSGGAVAVAAATFAMWMARKRRKYQQELAHLRQRIAADLHDEIGSNLGSIALLARLAVDQQTADVRADLADIQRIAQETADSMRDIVWLIQPGPRDASDLIARMREVAGSLLAGIDWRFQAEAVAGPFSLDFERQVFLLFKEALNNIRKHSQARRVTIHVVQRNGEFVLRINDDGAGFDPAAATGGLGLASMRHRAEVIAASLHLDSKSNYGTQLELRARLA